MKNFPKSVILLTAVYVLILFSSCKRPINNLEMQNLASVNLHYSVESYSSLILKSGLDIAKLSPLYQSRAMTKYRKKDIYISIYKDGSSSIDIKHTPVTTKVQRVHIQNNKVDFFDVNDRLINSESSISINLKHIYDDYVKNNGDIRIPTQDILVDKKSGTLPPPVLNFDKNVIQVKDFGNGIYKYKVTLDSSHEDVPDEANGYVTYIYVKKASNICLGNQLLNDQNEIIHQQLVTYSEGENPSIEITEDETFFKNPTTGEPESIKTINLFSDTSISGTYN